MPHLGTLFGLTEDATSIILVEMGCLAERQNGTTTVTRLQGWGDLAAEFKVQSLIEIGTTQFKGNSVWYVCLGNPPEGLTYPSQIFRKYMNNPKSVIPPTRLGSQAINKFATTELVGIRKDRIKRAHQSQMRNGARLMRLQNKGLKMDLQAKFQGLKHVKDIQRIQAAVASSQKRKLTRKVPLADKRKLEKKAKRNEKRNDVWELKQVEAPGKQVPAPRERLKSSLKEQQE